MPPQLVEHTTSPLLPEDGRMSPTERVVKCVLVGDGAVGKTSMVVSYTTNGYPTEYVPTAFDNYSVVVTVDEKPVRLQLCDTAGQDEFDNLRPLCYPQTDVFFVCFSVVCPTSFNNLVEKWVPEVRRHCPKTPIILIGTQSDLRESVNVLIDLARYGEKPVSESEARLRAHEVGAIAYMECSSLTQKNLKEAFDSAIISGIEYQDSRKGKKCRDKPYKPKPVKAVKQPNKAKPKPNRSSLATEKAKEGWKKFCCFLAS
ncbi:cell division control protein 42 homolog [Branchiostoma floridae]|uniref:Cell division control protein 42 homolog n=1 Tax=Branchiostoma floridae TaxID=7739 RepID=A0A9J7L1Y9_BRAFL|nr:cell division control protein 42 homolog [Branchiostoma floridae]